MKACRVRTADRTEHCVWVMVALRKQARMHKVKHETVLAKRKTCSQFKNTRTEKLNEQWNSPTKTPKLCTSLLSTKNHQTVSTTFTLGITGMRSQRSTLNGKGQTIPADERVDTATHSSNCFACICCLILLNCCFFQSARIGLSTSLMTTITVLLNSLRQIASSAN